MTKAEDRLKGLEDRLRKGIDLETSMFEGIPIKSTDDAARTLLSFLREEETALNFNPLMELANRAYDKTMQMFPKPKRKKAKKKRGNVKAGNVDKAKG